MLQTAWFRSWLTGSWDACAEELGRHLEAVTPSTCHTRPSHPTCQSVLQAQHPFATVLQHNMWRKLTWGSESTVVYGPVLRVPVQLMETGVNLLNKFKQLSTSWSCESSWITHLLFRHGPVTVTATELSNCPSTEMAALWSLLIREDITLTENAKD